MKIKNLILFLFTSILLSGLVIAGFISARDKEAISTQINQNQFQVSESYNTASVSKGTILLLLAVGLIGFLGISRKKKELGSPAQRNETIKEPDHQNSNEDKQKPIAKNS
jgi:ABC-type Fe3+ transport system permease subunit